MKKLPAAASIYRNKRAINRNSCLRFLFSLLVTGILFCPTSHAEDDITEIRKKPKPKSKVHPIDAIKRENVFKDALPDRSGISSKVNNQELYTAKWFEPGSFYGQIFLSENGYLNIYEWLQVPSQYSLIETTITKKNEYLMTSRSFLNNKSSFLDMAVIAPHPRSFEAIKLGLVPDYQALFPSDPDIEERSNIQIDDRRNAEMVVMKSGVSKLIYTAANGTRIVITIEHYRYNQNAINLMKALNLGLFDQRVQS